MTAAWLAAAQAALEEAAEVGGRARSPLRAAKKK